MERFFGPGARNGLKQMGGINKVAIALSGKSVFISYKKVFLIWFSCEWHFCTFVSLESPSIDNFGMDIGMTKNEIDNLRLILVSVEQGDIGILHSLGIKVK